MSTSSSLKRLISIGLAFGLTAPLTATARDMRAFPEVAAKPDYRTLPTASSPARITGLEGIPVSYTEFTMNGRRAYVLVAQVPDEVARATFTAVAQANAGHFSYGVSSAANDPVREWVTSMTGLAGQGVELPDDLTTIPGVVKEKDASLKARFIAKVKSMAGQVRSKPLNTVAAIGYAGTISAGEVFWVSGSVSAATTVFVPLALVSLFTATQGDWAKFVGRLGEKSVTGMAAALKAVGIAHEMTKIEKRVVRAGGQFGLMYAMSATEVTGVTYMTGLHVDPVHVAITAFAYSYAAFDAVVIRWVDTHMISHATEALWFLTQYIGGTAAALAMYQHVSGVETGLSMFVASAFTYLAFGEYVESAFRRGTAMVKYAFDGVKATMTGTNIPPLKRRLAAARVAAGVARRLNNADCNTLLMSSRGGWSLSPWRTQSIRRVD